MIRSLPSLMMASAFAILSIFSSTSVNAHERHEHHNKYTRIEVGECREYVQDVWIHGRKKVARGTACFRRDGSWKIISSNYNHHRYYGFKAAGPIVILPQKYAYNTHHKHQPHVVYKKSPTVIYKSDKPSNWGYRFPADDHKHGNKGNKHKNDHHHKHKQTHTYNSGGVTLEFNW